MNLFTKQKQTQETNLCLLKGNRERDKLGVWDQQIEIIYKINKILLYSTGNYIQYLVINYNGKEYEKEKNMYTYITEYMYN